MLTHPKHPECPSPYLAQEINEVMDKEVDIVIFQVGSSEMTNLDLSWDKQKLFSSMLSKKTVTNL